MAIASANAAPMIIGRNTVPLASGLRPIASIALPTANPMPIPGPRAPSPMARPDASGPYDAGPSCKSRSKNIPFLLVYVGDPQTGRTPRAPAAGSVVAGLARCLMVSDFVLRRERHERQRKQCEDQRLDHSNEELQSQEDDRHGDRHQ